MAFNVVRLPQRTHSSSSTSSLFYITETSFFCIRVLALVLELHFGSPFLYALSCAFRSANEKSLHIFQLAFKSSMLQRSLSGQYYKSLDNSRAHCDIVFFRLFLKSLTKQKLTYFSAAKAERWKFTELELTLFNNERELSCSVCFFFGRALGSPFDFPPSAQATRSSLCWQKFLRLRWDFGEAGRHRYRLCRVNGTSFRLILHTLFGSRIKRQFVRDDRRRAATEKLIGFVSAMLSAHVA